jgi:hypothetical protein
MSATCEDMGALLVDVPVDELKNCFLKAAFLWVHPDEYRPGKHRNEDQASGALEDMMAIRH